MLLLEYAYYELVVDRRRLVLLVILVVPRTHNSSCCDVALHPADSILQENKIATEKDPLHAMTARLLPALALIAALSSAPRPSPPAAEAFNFNPLRPLRRVGEAPAAGHRRRRQSRQRQRGPGDGGGTAAGGANRAAAMAAMAAPPPPPQPPVAFIGATDLDHLGLDLSQSVAASSSQSSSSLSSQSSSSSSLSSQSSSSLSSQSSSSLSSQSSSSLSSQSSSLPPPPPMGLGDLRQRVGRIQARVGSVPPVLALRSGETGPIELLRREIGPPRGLADMGEMLLLLPAEGPAGGNREGTATATATATGAVAAWGRSPTAQLLGEAARRAGRALSDLVGAADLLLRAMWATALRDGEMREVLAGAASVVRSSLPTHLYGVVATGTGTGAEALPPPPRPPPREVLAGARAVAVSPGGGAAAVGLAAWAYVLGVACSSDGCAGVGRLRDSLREVTAAALFAATAVGRGLASLAAGGAARIRRARRGSPAPALAAGRRERQSQEQDEE